MKLNPLSQLLYWGNVAGNMGGFLVFAGIVLAICAVVATCAFFGMLEGEKDARRQEQKVVQASPFAFCFMMLFVLLALASWAAAAFCPSSTTVYAIAASQMGEQALKSPVATKAGVALEAWLDKQIATTKDSTPTSVTVTTTSDDNKTDTKK